VLNAPAPSNGEPSIAFVGLDELRRTVIRMVARRAAAILKEAKNGDQGSEG